MAKYLQAIAKSLQEGIIMSALLDKNNELHRNARENLQLGYNSFFTSKGSEFLRESESAVLQRVVCDQPQRVENAHMISLP